MGEGQGGVWDNFKTEISKRLPQRPASKEQEQKVSEWDGFIKVRNPETETETKTHVVIHGNGFEKFRDEQGKESVRIKEGVIPIFVGVGGADKYRTYPFDKELIRRGYTVVGWDPPGQTGESDSLKDKSGHLVDHTMEAYAEFQDKLYSTLTNGKIIIAAMSMGGIPAEIFAGAHPDKIHKLILAATFATLKGRVFTESVTKKIEIKALDSRVSLQFALQAQVDSLDLPPEERAEAVRRFFNNKLILSRAKTILQSFASILTTDASASCRAIKANTLLLAGKDDKLAPVEGMELMRGLITNSKLVVVNAGHTGVLGNKDHFNPESMATIIQFLEEEKPSI